MHRAQCNTSSAAVRVLLAALNMLMYGGSDSIVRPIFHWRIDPAICARIFAPTTLSDSSPLFFFALFLSLFLCRGVAAGRCTCKNHRQDAREGTVHRLLHGEIQSWRSLGFWVFWNSFYRWFFKEELGQVRTEVPEMFFDFCLISPFVLLLLVQMGMSVRGWNLRLRLIVCMRNKRRILYLSFHAKWIKSRLYKVSQ